MPISLQIGCPSPAQRLPRAALNPSFVGLSTPWNATTAIGGSFALDQTCFTPAAPSTWASSASWASSWSADGLAVRDLLDGLDRSARHLEREVAELEGAAGDHAIDEDGVVGVIGRELLALAAREVLRVAADQEVLLAAAVRDGDLLIVSRWRFSFRARYAGRLRMPKSGLSASMAVSAALRSVK